MPTPPASVPFFALPDRLSFPGVSESDLGLWPLLQEPQREFIGSSGPQAAGEVGVSVFMYSPGLLQTWGNSLSSPPGFLL